MARVCAMSAHTQRHDGASPDQWQPWLALAAAGSVLGDRRMLARSLALVSQVYEDLAGAMPASEPVPSSAANHALLHILGLSPADRAPTGPDREHLELIDQRLDSLTQDDCLALLAGAIGRKDWDRCRELFDVLASLALENHPGNWDAELQPGYEPAPAAICAVARQRGFAPGGLKAASREWLWPAIESVPGITPVIWPLEFSQDC